MSALHQLVDQGRYDPLPCPGLPSCTKYGLVMKIYKNDIAYVKWRYDLPHLAVDDIAYVKWRYALPHLAVLDRQL